MSAVPHIGFIVAAYLVAGAAILVMIGAILLDYRLLTRALARLQATRGETEAR
ncbi:MAG: heme exporter protein CcmD [Bradyrhizobium sp.]|nr:MAG: heme exporter protein CcmD [Bradyrhizobium sp.]